MSIELSEKREISWVGQAVFALDRWLRRRQGSYEFSSSPTCLFRIEPCVAEGPLRLSDGTRVQRGEAALKLHLWNEHIPRMGRRGPTVGWARQVTRAMDGSLRELSHYLARHPELSGVRVLFGDMCLGPNRQTRQFKRFIARYGFETVQGAEPCEPQVLRRIGLTILILLLVLATNPIALRRAPVRHRRKRVYLSRAGLDARYGGLWQHAGRPGGLRRAFSDLDWQR